MGRVGEDVEFPRICRICWHFVIASYHDHFWLLPVESFDPRPPYRKCIFERKSNSLSVPHLPTFKLQHCA